MVTGRGYSGRIAIAFRDPCAGAWSRHGVWRCGSFADGCAAGERRFIHGRTDRDLEREELRARGVAGAIGHFVGLASGYTLRHRRMTTANQITIFRILLIPVFMGAALGYGQSCAAGSPHEAWRYAAIGIFIFGLFYFRRTERRFADIA